MKDYNANTTSSSSSNNTTGQQSNGVSVASSAESEDEDEPRTPTSVSSQGSQGYDSGGSDFVDIESFAQIPDSSLPELNLQVIFQKNIFTISKLAGKKFVLKLEQFF